jgi:ATP-dependent helicase HrpA
MIALPDGLGRRSPTTQEQSSAACRYPTDRIPAGAAGQRAPRRGGALIREHQVVVLCGETGSGKSTQLPKICLDASLGLGRGIFGRIGHTQPRRIAARSLASRVSQELGTELGTTVGYKVRFHDRVQPGPASS